MAIESREPGRGRTAAWRLALATACSAVLLAATPATQAAVVLYALGVGTSSVPSPGGLYQVNTTDGSATRVQNLGFFAHQGGLAYDPVGDMLYASGYDNSSQPGLWRIDRFNHTESFVGHLGGVRFDSGGIAIDPATGRMFGVAPNGQNQTGFYEIDKQTAGVSLIGQNLIPTPLGPNGRPLLAELVDLSFAADGSLLAIGTYRELFEVQAFNALFSIDPSSGVATILGQTGQQLLDDPAEAPDGRLFSLGVINSRQQGLYQVNRQTGAATLVGATFVNDGPGNDRYFGASGGLAFAPDGSGGGGTPVPAPAPAALLLAAALAAGLARRRA